MTERKKMAGHAACFAAYAIFGFNIIVCKDLMGGHLVSPLAIFTLRPIGAGIIFWILSAFMPHEHVDRKDYPKIFAASFLGFFLTQITFLVAIPDVTPMHCSIISAMSPIYTMFIAAIVLKEPLSWQKVLAALMVFTGVFIVSRSRAAGNSAPHDGVYQRPQDFLGLRFALSVIRKPLAINRLDD